MKLSKTNYITYLDCKKNAWLKIHKPDIYYKYPLSSFELNIIETGNEIDVLARSLFPSGITIENREDEALTQTLMQQQTPVIYQPVFISDNYITACDILVWNATTEVYDLYEVKSSTASSESESSNRNTKDYLIDIAFQKVVCNELDVPIGKTFLIRLDKEYERHGDINVRGIFIIEDLSEQVDGILDDTAQRMMLAHDYLSQESEPKGHCDCILKGRKGFCTTAHYSISDLPDYPIQDILRIGNTKKKFTELVDSYIFDIQDVPQDFFEPESNYALQVNVAQSNREHVDGAGIEEFLETIQYPIAFLDYETYPSALPRFEGYRPYQQIPFQFSVHIKESPESTLMHYDFLHTKTGIPDHEFVYALKKHLPTSGSIIVWNKTFECKIINERLIQRHPEYSDFLNDLNNRVVDLMIPFSGNKKEGKDIIYQHPDQRGSYSIKAVLPIFAPELSYKALDIQEGGTASDTWNRIVQGEFSKEDATKKELALLEYCKLDTFAMVKIWEVLEALKDKAD
jgi:hypothetical protein